MVPPHGVIRLIMVVGAAAAVLAIVLLTGAWILAYWSTHPLRIACPLDPPEQDGRATRFDFRARDGTPLSGWLFERTDARAVILLCHGHQFNRMQMLPILRLLRDEPYSFLLFDFRRAGRSGGTLCTIGRDETADVLAAVDALQTRLSTRNMSIGVFGYSMGGAAAIMAAAADCRIRAVATQGAYASLDRAVNQRGRMFLGVAGPLLTVPATRMAKRWLEFDPAEVSPALCVHRIAPRPILLVHGKRDPFVRVDDAYILYHHAREPKRLVILPHSWHITVTRDDVAVFRQELRAFFRQTLLGEATVRGTTRRTDRTGTE